MVRPNFLALSKKVEELLELILAVLWVEVRSLDEVCGCGRAPGKQSNNLSLELVAVVQEQKIQTMGEAGWSRESAEPTRSVEIPRNNAPNHEKGFA
eukprot:scaffold66512_cov46-Attheya_sp.AAC.2